MRVIAALFVALGLSGPAQAMDFTKADDIEPILGMTKMNWVAVREWDGKDLLYFTHLITYRCGIEQVRYYINVGKPRIREMEECYWDLPQPFIIQDPNGYVIYDEFEMQSIQTITVEITLKNGTVLRETFERKQVWTP